jgi:formylglycine-generating enzyme required for sulfatase activity
LGDFGWFRGNSGGQPHPVAKKKPNAWGLFDMHGNVWEWCSDYVGPYAVGDIADPQGPNEGVPDISGDEDPYRIYRGGSYASGVDSLRSAGRLGYLPTRRDETYGFRVAMSVSGK